MEKTFKQKWRQFLSIGRQEHHNYLEIQRIALLNAISITTIIMSIIVTSIYVVFGFHRYVALLVIPMSLTIIYLNYKNKSEISKDVAFFGFLAIIIIWSFLTRRTSAILLLMVLCCSSAFLYIKKTSVYIRIIICAVVYIYYMYNDATTPFIPKDNINYPVINTILTILTCCLLLFYIMLSVDLIKYTSKKLNLKIEELKLLNEKQNNTQQELKKSNDELKVFNTMLDSMVKNSTKELQSYQKAIDDNLYSVVTDIDGTILKINDNYLKLVKYKEEELVGENFSILNSEQHSENYYQEIKNTINSGKVWRGETKNITKVGDYFWIVSSILPILDEQGNIIKFFTLSTNITEQKKAEDEQKIAFDNLIKSNNRLNLVLDNQSDLIVISNKSGMRKFVNIAYCEFFGKNKEQFIGTNYKTQEPERATPKYLNLIDSLSYDNPKITFLEVVENNLNDKRWIIWNELAVFNSNKEITEIFSFGHDITTLKQIEFQNANFIAQFEEIAFKTSHKIRGPLTNLIGIINLINDDEVKQDEFLEILEFIKVDVEKLDLTSRDLANFINNYQQDKSNLKLINEGNIDLEEAKSKHLNWKFKIKNFLEGSSSLTHNQATSSKYSELGKWYLNKGKEKYGHLEVIQKLEIEQEKLHNYVIEILDLKAKNDSVNSQIQYQKLLLSSDTILQYLDKAEESLRNI